MTARPRTAHGRWCRQGGSERVDYGGVRNILAAWFAPGTHRPDDQHRRY